ncbi:hypothetical protein PVAP13_6KG356506 [Panicum virgatum]|uniref:Uncharacterized protein n=1 Tax=Panicum virgatum TaxID=38727 RepID=A0A8T0RGG6_PANVG|nr:hypothetical protein PVAP13_6KG356506 [Panicum virgatum]
MGRGDERERKASPSKPVNRSRASASWLGGVARRTAAGRWSQQGAPARAPGSGGQRALGRSRGARPRELRAAGELWTGGEQRLRWRMGRALVRAPRDRRWCAAGGVVRWCGLQEPGDGVQLEGRVGWSGGGGAPRVGSPGKDKKIRGSSRIPNTFIYYILVWKIHVLEVLRVYEHNGYG